MKRLNILLILLSLVVGGCKNGDRSGNESDTFFIVDVKKSYPSKELTLQDFMDVEYIALETSDEFLCQGKILGIGENLILVGNSSLDGNLYLFNRKGKGVRKINRHGQGGEEYAFMYGAILDEENEEIFINDIMTKKIMVYDLYGNFKRSFQYNEGSITDNIYDYDKNHLFCTLEVNVNSEKQDKSTLALISKQDGSIADKLEIHYKENKSTSFVSESDFLLYPYSPILPWQDSWILTEASSDTVFCFSSKHMVPFMVRTPSIQAIDPEIFLFPKMFTDRYYFIERVKKKDGFLRNDWVYDRKDGALYEYTLFNADYTKKQQINMTLWETQNDEIGYWQKMNAHDLVSAYNKGELQGKLKDIANGLNEDSNPVVMLVKNK